VGDRTWPFGHLPLCRACRGIGENGANVTQLFAELALALSMGGVRCCEVPLDKSLASRSIVTPEGQL